MSRSSRQKLSRLLYLAAAVVIVLTAFFVVHQPSTSPPAPVRVAPKPSTSPLQDSPLSSPTPSVTASKQVTSSPEVHASPMVAMRIPAIGLRLRVEKRPLGSPIDPPFVTSTVDSTVYQDASRGMNPGTDAWNATYIAGHTWRGGHAAFNTVDTSLRLHDDVYVMTSSSKHQGVWLHYVVTRKFLYQKDALATPTNPLWQVHPRLVLITCHLNGDGSEQDHNSVFFARLVGLTQLKK